MQWDFHLLGQLPNAPAANCGCSLTLSCYPRCDMAVVGLLRARTLGNTASSMANGTVLMLWERYIPGTKASLSQLFLHIMKFEFPSSICTLTLFPFPPLSPPFPPLSPPFPPPPPSWRRMLPAFAQTNYCNPLCACAPRVNNSQWLLPVTGVQ